MLRWRGSAAVLAVATLVGGCGGESSTPEPTLPPRPAVPEGWRTVTTDEGDVVMALPREFVVGSTSGAISGFPELDGPASTGVIVMGPETHELEAGQTVDQWIEANNWLTAQRDGARLGPVQRERVLLPAGPALEITASYEADGAAAWSILYVIDTGREPTVARFGGDGAPPDDLPDELALIRDLMAFPQR